METREELKKFVKEHPFTPEILDKIIYKFDLQNVDLSIEKTRIEEKRSYLSARQRKAVMELIQIKQLMEEIERDKEIEEKSNEVVDLSTN